MRKIAHNVEVKPGLQCDDPEVGVVEQIARHKRQELMYRWLFNLRTLIIAAMLVSGFTGYEVIKTLFNISNASSSSSLHDDLKAWFYQTPWCGDAASFADYVRHQGKFDLGLFAEVFWARFTNDETACQAMIGGFNKVELDPETISNFKITETIALAPSGQDVASIFTITSNSHEWAADRQALGVTENGVLLTITTIGSQGRSTAITTSSEIQNYYYQHAVGYPVMMWRLGDTFQLSADGTNYGPNKIAGVEGVDYSNAIQDVSRIFVGVNSKGRVSFLPGGDNAAFDNQYSVGQPYYSVNLDAPTLDAAVGPYYAKAISERRRYSLKAEPSQRLRPLILIGVNGGGSLVEIRIAAFAILNDNLSAWLMEQIKLADIKLLVANDPDVGWSDNSPADGLVAWGEERFDLQLVETGKVQEVISDNLPYNQFFSRNKVAQGLYLVVVEGDYQYFNLPYLPFDLSRLTEADAVLQTEIFPTLDFTPDGNTNPYWLAPVTPEIDFNKHIYMFSVLQKDDATGFLTTAMQLKFAYQNEHWEVRGLEYRSYQDSPGWYENWGVSDVTLSNQLVSRVLAPYLVQMYPERTIVLPEPPPASANAKTEWQYHAHTTQSETQG